MKNLIARSILLISLLSCSTRSENRRMPEPEAGKNVVPSKDTSTALREKYRGHIAAFVDSLFGRSHMSGSILVAKDGQILFEQYFGQRNPRSASAGQIDSNTAFHLASVSKTITATAILQLWQEGKLDIHDPLTRYFPSFPSPDVTIMSLLNHRSGLPNYVHYMERLGWDKKRFVTNQDVLDFLIKRHKDIDIGPANRHFSYSNTNYALLALVIEKLSGMSYPDYIRKNIFEPLGMTHSFVFTRTDSAGALPSYYYSGRPYPFEFLDYVYGDKNVYSTVRDLFRFNEALEDGRLLNDSVLAAAYTPYSFEKPGIHNYGLGWRMYVLKNGKKLIYHNGWWHGNRTSFCRLIDEHAVIIALCNNDDKMVYRVKQLADLFGDYRQHGSENPWMPDDDPENSTVKRPAHHPSHSKIYYAKSRKKTAVRHSLTAKK